MSLSNKKELFAAINDMAMQGFDEQGREITFTLFEDLDSSKANEINRAIYQNLNDYFDEMMTPMGNGIFDMKIDLNMPAFTKAAARNLALDTELEVAHFLMRVGYMFYFVQSKVKEMKEGKP